VTVVVLEQNDIYVTGGDITLTVIPASDGSPTSVSNSGCDLYWITNSNRPKKITVQTNLASPRYRLTVEGQNVEELAADPKSGKAGTPAGVVVLAGLTPRLFIDQIKRVFARCDLFYTATASTADLPGSETHTVTYTLLDR